jgi:integrase
VARRKQYPLLFLRHGSPFWYFFWRDRNGVRHERSTKQKDQGKADEVREKFCSELKFGHFPTEMENWSLEEACRAWLEFRQHRIAKGSLDSERTTTRNLIRVLEPSIRLRALADPSKIEYYQSRRLDDGAKAKTVNNEVLVLKGILERADLWHSIGQRVKKLKVEVSEVGAALTEEQCLRLIRYAKATDDMSVVPFAALLALGSGLRKCEIKALRLGDIHLDDPRGPYVYVRRESTKSDAGSRYCVLDPLAAWAIRKLLNRASQLGSHLPTHHLFPAFRPAHTRSNDPLRGGTGFDPDHHQTEWEWEWDRLRQDINLRCRFHDLRHSYCSRAATSGVPLAVLQAQMGHMSKKMVEHYTHISSPALHDAAAKIAAGSTALISALISQPVKTAVANEEQKLFMVKNA